MDWRASMLMLSLSPKSPFWQLHLKDVQVVGPVYLSEEHHGGVDVDDDANGDNSNEIRSPRCFPITISNVTTLKL